MTKGKFITFEGGEGAGKSTQVARLAHRLKALGLGVVVSREPGGSAGAEAIRHVLLSGAAKPLGPHAEAILFAAARDDHLRQTIRPALERGQWVICDRFADSTRIYQGVLGNVDARLIARLEKVDGRRTRARSHHHPRHRAGNRARARDAAARRRAGRPVRGRGARFPQEAARGLSGACRARAGALRGDRRRRAIRRPIAELVWSAVNSRAAVPAEAPLMIAGCAGR